LRRCRPRIRSIFGRCRRAGFHGSAYLKYPLNPKANSFSRLPSINWIFEGHFNIQGALHHQSQCLLIRWTRAILPAIRRRPVLSEEELSTHAIIAAVPEQNAMGNYPGQCHHQCALKILVLQQEADMNTCLLSRHCIGRHSIPSTHHVTF
jgi:hypothetical protein